MEKITTTGLDLVNVPRFTTRPPMHFVSIKTRGDQAACIVLRTRELFVRQRSQTANALRAHMAEMGIIAAAGKTSIATAPKRCRVYPASVAA